MLTDAGSRIRGSRQGRRLPRGVRVQAVQRLPATQVACKPWDGLARGIVASTCLAHLVYLLWLCPLDLSPDEAHYWQWSQQLDWAYYSKGPLVAWLIRVSWEAFGGLSLWLTGSEAAAVRWPAIACHAALLWGVYRLMGEALASHRLALAGLVVGATLPPLTAGAILMTIDAPFLAAWAWSLVYLHRAVLPSFRPRPADRGGNLLPWLAAGLCTGLALLAKFSALVLVGALALYLLGGPPQRGWLRTPGPWLFLAVVALAACPLLIWNLQHDWLEVRHVLGQVAGRGASLAHPLTFLAGQFGLLLGYWLIAFFAAAWRFRPWGEGNRLAGQNNAQPRVVTPSSHCRLVVTSDDATRAGKEFLWFFSVPVWLVYLLASVRTPGQVNWAASAYVAGLPLAVAWVGRQITAPSLGYRRMAQAGLALALGLAIFLSLAIHFPGTLLRPMLTATLAPPPTADRPMPLRQYDPTCRLMGWRALAQAVDSLRERLRRQTGSEPILAGMVWTLPGELAFYCQGHPPAYSFGSALADRASQYDIWRPNPVNDAQEFLGRTFIYVGEEIPGMNRLFEWVEPPIRVEYSEAGQTLAAWTVWVGHGFRGWDELPHNPHKLRRY